MVTTNMNEHKNAVDMGLIDRVERELLDLLDDKGKANVKETLEKKFNHKPVKLLGVSTYVLKKNGVETKMESIPDQEVGHFRLIEPLLYMMVQMGIIKGEVKSPKQIGGGDGEDDEPPRRWWKRKGRKV